MIPPSLMVLFSLFLASAHLSFVIVFLIFLDLAQGLPEPSEAIEGLGQLWSSKRTLPDLEGNTGGAFSS